MNFPRICFRVAYRQTLLPFLAAFIVAGCGGTPQQPSYTVDTSIRNIRLSVDTAPVFTGRSQQNELIEQVHQINLLLITDSVYLDSEEYMEEAPDGGASLTGYFFNNRLVKLTEWAGLSYGVTEREFYFANDSLIGVVTEEKYFYADEKGTDHSRFSGGFRGNYYFSADTLAGTSTLGERRFGPEDAGSFPQMARQLKALVLGKRKSK